MNGLRICNAVEVTRNLQSNRARQEPEIPPAEPAQDHLAQGRRIMQDQPGDRPLRPNMERGACAETRAVKHNWLAIRMALQFVERRERCRPDPRKPRRSSAAAESWIIHSPDFDGAIVPFFSLRGHPALRAIGIAVKAQDVNVRSAFGSRQIGLCSPNFQLSVFERNGFSDGPARIDRRPSWKQNQMVRQMTEKHRGKVYDADCEDYAKSGQNLRFRSSASHICSNNARLRYL